MLKPYSTITQIYSFKHFQYRAIQVWIRAKPQKFSPAYSVRATR